MAGRAMNDRVSVQRRLTRLRERLSAIDGQHVRIVAVTKGRGVSTVESAVAAGCVEIAESYAQELLYKNQALPAHGEARPQVHFVGGLQSNKIRKLVSVVDVWQSIDRLDLGAELARRSPQAQAMVQVDLSGETGRRGCPLTETPELVERLGELGLNVIGLMGIGPIGAPESAREGFALLRGLVDQLGLAECSMGMTADMEVAVQEGSTMVRIGTGLFGERSRRARTDS